MLNFIRTAKAVSVMLVLMLVIASRAYSANAIDPATIGSFAPNSSEYKLTAKIDPNVTTAVATELWARVWYPSGTGLPQQLPLVVMLHGEHGTCGKLDPTGQWYIDDRADYTLTGACPAGYRVTPSHWGYDYIGNLLSTHGYVVISINANRGVNQAPEVAAENDRGNIQRRGRLILRHLQMLGTWAANGGTPKSVGFDFKGRLDFAHVSLFGHSRGAEAIAAAMVLFTDNSSPWPARLPANINFVSLAAIAPSDFQTSNNPSGTFGQPYGVLLPMCDGDVIRLMGIKFYDIAVGLALDAPGNYKTTFATWGADHDGYNSEWQTQDSWDFANDVATKQDCPGQTKLFPKLGVSFDQQQLGRRFAMAIIRSTTESRSYAQLLDPAFALPKAIASIARVDRGFMPGVSTKGAKRLVQFQGNGKCATELFTTTGTVGSCGRAPEHDQLLTWIARVRWGAPAGSTPSNTNFAHFVFNGGQPVDLSAMKTLEFRLGPDCVLSQPTKGSATDYGCSKPSLQGAGLTGSQDVHMLLADKNGNFTQYVWFGSYTDNRQAVGINEVPVNGQTLINPLYHAIMSSVRVPIADLAPATPFDLKNVTGAWFFLGYQGSSGGLFVGDIIATNVPVTSPDMQPAPVARLPLPPSGATLQVARSDLTGDPVAQLPAVEPAPVTAAAGHRILGARRISWPVGSTQSPAAEAPMVEFTLRTPRPMIENTSGYFISIGSTKVAARHTATSPADPAVISLAVPVESVLSAAAGAGLTVTSGASHWDFGQISLKDIH